MRDVQVLPGVDERLHREVFGFAVGSCDVALGALTIPPNFSQVPFGTNFHSSGRLSLGANPAHAGVEVPQSFCPFLAPPKHFSWPSAASGSCATATVAPNAITPAIADWIKFFLALK